MKKPEKRLTIGLIISYLFPEYQNRIWKSIADKAEANDINLICYTGDTPVGDTIYMSIYDIVDVKSVAGLIVLPDFLTYTDSLAEVARFFEKYRVIPVVTIGKALEEITSVCIDNTGALYDLTKHLISVHHYKNFLYLAGPENSQDAIARKEGFEKALTEAGIPVDQEKIFYGTFDNSFGRTLVEKLVREHRLHAEAIVCGNDPIAVGVIEALTAANYKIPGEIAVTGFDNINIDITPGLTTVEQSLDMLGDKAFDLLLAKIRQVDTPKMYYLPCHLILRESCGCASQIQTEIQVSNAAISRKAIISYIERLSIPDAKKDFLIDWFIKFMDAMTSYLDDTGRNELNSGLLTDSDFQKIFDLDLMRIWHELFLMLQRALISDRQYNPKTVKLLSLIYNINAAVQKNLLCHRMDASPMHAQYLTVDYNFLYFHHEFSEIDNYEWMQLAMSERFPSLKIASCYIAEFDTPVAGHESIIYTLPQYAHSLLAYQKNNLIALTEKQKRMLTRDLIPRELYPASRHTLIVMPLIVFKVAIGIIVIPRCGINSFFYQDVRGVFAATLSIIRNIEALKAARMEAEAANRAKSVFLANITHELRTPLNSILGFADLLLEETADPGILNKLMVINVSGRHLFSLVNDLLDFSKLDAGKGILHARKFSLYQFCTHINNMFKIIAAQKDLLFTCTMDAALPEYVVGDERRINQVMVNVVGNAFKFTREGKISVQYTYEADCLLIRVADTGIGIPAAKLKDIFFPFIQADSSTTRQFGGTGLGLAITDRLVAQMGGKITVTSELGKGSLFTVKLPLRIAGAENENTDEQALNDDLNSCSAAGYGDNSVNKQHEDDTRAVNCRLTRAQYGQLLALITSLENCRRVFDEELLKQAADKLLQLSPEIDFTADHAQLYFAAAEYEPDIIDNILNKLKKICGSADIST